MSPNRPLLGLGALLPGAGARPRCRLRARRQRLEHSRSGAAARPDGDDADPGDHPEGRPAQGQLHQHPRSQGGGLVDMATITNEMPFGSARLDGGHRRGGDLRAGGRAARGDAEPARIIRRPSSTACCAIGWSAWPRRASRRWRSPRRSRARARRRRRSTRRSRSARADATASSSSTPICGARAWPRCWGCAPTRACATSSTAARRSTTACGASARTSSTCCRPARRRTTSRRRSTTRGSAT